MPENSKAPGESATEPAPLEGVRVLDLTSVLAGPYSTRLLADLGAEIIKIEPPEGDHKRTVKPMRGNYSTTFAQANCGKKSIVLDLKSNAGRKAAFELALKSDVVVENWRPGVARKLGLDYETLRQSKPNIICCSISGYGQTGPNAMRPAYAPILHAASGYELASMRYQSGADRPGATGIYIGDVISGLTAFGAISAALHKLRATGRGQFIDVAMFDCMMNLLVYEYHEHVFDKAPRRIFPSLKTRDGFVVVAPVTKKNFDNLARCVGHPEWIDDPMFNTPAARLQNWDQIMANVELWTQERTSAECEELMEKGDVPCSRYRHLHENLDQSLTDRGALATVRDGAGDLVIPAAPFQMPNGNAYPRPRVPELGEDTTEVLRDILGYSENEIAGCLVPTKGHAH